MPWLGGKAFRPHLTHRIFPIRHAEQWRKRGGPVFSMPASTGETISLGFSIFKFPPGATSTALAGRTQPMGHMKLIQQRSGQMLFYVNACAVQQIRAKLTVAACRSTRERRRPHYFYSDHYRVRVREVEKV